MTMGTLIEAGSLLFFLGLGRPFAGASHAIQAFPAFALAFESS
jgi:hypothetical protein